MRGEESAVPGGAGREGAQVEVQGGRGIRPRRGRKGGRRTESDGERREEGERGSVTKEQK